MSSSLFYNNYSDLCEEKMLTDFLIFLSFSIRAIQNNVLNKQHTPHTAISLLNLIYQ